MRRSAKIALLSLTVVILLVGGVAVYALTVESPVPFEDPVPLEVREANTAGAIALTRLGIESYTVDATSERVLLIYELPSWAHGNASAAEAYQRLVLAAGAAAARFSENVIAAQAVGGAASRLWIASVADFQAFEAGDLTAQDLESRIDKAHI